MSPRRARNPADDDLFAPARRPALRAAVAELSWLLDRGYTEDAGVALVGDRHALTARQRKAVRRAACTTAARDHRRARRIALADLRGRALAVDGLNCLITLESALGHGTVVVGRDGAHRDLAGVHGAYDLVAETAFAVEILGRLLAGAVPREVTWYLDRPVSQSARLAARLREVAAARGWPWEVALVRDPDPVLAACGAVVATSDAWILDRCGPWVDLLGELLRPPDPAPPPSAAAGPTLAMRPDLWLVDLSDGAPDRLGEPEPDPV